MRHSIEADRSGSRLAVGLKDAAVKLTGTRRSAVYNEQKDSEIVSKILKDANITAGTIADTTANSGQVVQYYCTDWDFIVSRADAHGYCVAIDDGELSVKDLAISGIAQIKFSWGMSRDLRLGVCGRRRPPVRGGRKPGMGPEEPENDRCHERACRIGVAREPRCSEDRGTHWGSRNTR